MHLLDALWYHVYMRKPPATRRSLAHIRHDMMVDISIDAELASGCLAIHNDGYRKHLAIVLQAHPQTLTVLFFTSNPFWSSYCRKARSEELALANFVSTKKTYLTLVERFMYEFEPKTGPVFDSDYVSRLVNEFDPR